LIPFCINDVIIIPLFIYTGYAGQKILQNTQRMALKSHQVPDFNVFYSD